MIFNIGEYKITSFIHSYFRLDGGAMFGSIPKNIWEKKIPADSENCIPLVARSLLIEYKDRKILVDTNLGNCWSEKEINIFAINNVNQDKLPYKTDEITDVILTHLHFDHAGGISFLNKENKYEATYKNAIHHIQSDNIDNAKNPLIKEKASYRENVVSVLSKLKLNILNGNTEIFPFFSLKQVNGHTKGQQILIIKSESETIAFPSDLIPTSHHLKLPFCMGYDICGETLLKEKEEFLNEAQENDYQIIFQHDRDVECFKL